MSIKGGFPTDDDRRCFCWATNAQPQQRQMRVCRPLLGKLIIFAATSTTVLQSSSKVLWNRIMLWPNLLPLTCRLSCFAINYSAITEMGLSPVCARLSLYMCLCMRRCAPGSVSVRGLKLENHFYADDTRLYISFDNYFSSGLVVCVLHCQLRGREFASPSEQTSVSRFIASTLTIHCWLDDQRAY